MPELLSKQEIEEIFDTKIENKVDVAVLLTRTIDRIQEILDEYGDTRNASKGVMMELSFLDVLHDSLVPMLDE